MFTTGIRGQKKESDIEAKEEGNGILFRKDRGFFGVVLGAAGSGKSILALQLGACCKFYDDNGDRIETKVVYLSHDHPEAVLRRLLNFEPSVYVSGKKTEVEQSVQYFGKQDCRVYLPPTITQNQNRGQGEWLASEGLHIVKFPFEVQEQVDVLMNIVDRARIEQDSKPVQWLVLFDNAETILPEAYEQAFDLKNGGDAAHLYGAKEAVFLKRLRNYFGQSGVSSIFFFEEPGSHDHHASDDISKTAFAYAADLLIHLGCRTVSEYRQRTIEIVKARNQSHRRGRHPFSIRGGDEYRADSNEKPGIVIFPSLATQLYVIGNKRREEAKASGIKSPTGKGERAAAQESRIKEPPAEGKASAEADYIAYRLGIDEIDNEITRDAYLRKGTISVLVSDLDSLASEIALHFALRNFTDDSEAGANKRQETQIEKALYITTLHDEDTLLRMLDRYKELEKRRSRLKVMELRPEHINEGKLLKDIEKAIVDSKATRVVFDNVFELSKHFPLINDEKHFLTAIFAMLRYKKVAAMVVDMVEVGEGRNPVSGSFAAGIADHIFALRHAELRSELSRVFSVLKLAAVAEPKKLWELVEGKDRIIAEDRLAFFKGVLSGRIEPVDVKLSLFAESEESPLHKYIKTRERVLQETFGHKLQVHTCTTHTYSALQQSVEDHVLYALGDCHVISIDEIWLEELISVAQGEEPYLIDITSALPKGDEWKYTAYVTAGQLLAILEWKKKNAGEGKSTTEETKKDRIKALELTYAVPDRNNVGILTFAPNLLDQWGTEKIPGSRVDRWKDLPDHIIESTLEEFKDVFNETEREEFAETARGSGATGAGAGEFLRILADRLNPREHELSWKHIIKLQDRFVRFAGNLTNRLLSSSERAMYIKQPTTRETFKYTIPDRVPPLGVFTCSMETRETCISFFLELLLSVLDEGEDNFPVDINSRQLKWNDLRVSHSWMNSQGLTDIPEGTSAWAGALILMAKLLTPWDILQLSHGWYRTEKHEPPNLFSRQWFSGWGALGQDRPGLKVLELPKGAAGVPTPVSGAWYLGILKGSTAKRAGASIITQMASPNDELHKFNRGIAMPVRRDLYKQFVSQEDSVSFGPIEARQIVPYGKQFLELADAKVDPTIKLQRSRCPFYRQVIKDYRHVSPLLMGMIVEAARIVLRPEHHKFLWRKEDEVERLQVFQRLRDDFEKLVKRVATRYEKLWEQ